MVLYLHEMQINNIFVVVVGVVVCFLCGISRSHGLATNLLTCYK